MDKEKNKIAFVLDGKIEVIDFANSPDLEPTTTVLNYLRSRSNHKGVKEGCAEGDCGACTVVFGETNDYKNLSYKAYDSCLIFLPMLHGKQLITVENLGSSSDLHPVQSAMVETDGSQCGYCTPGFIMSLFSLYKNEQNPTRDQINDGLTGNLCRCTGYRSIVEAASKSCVHEGIDHFTDHEPEIMSLLKKIQSDFDSVEIEIPNNRYFQPTSLNEALSLRQKFPDTLIVTGATDVGLRVTKNHEHLDAIIDFSQIAELKTVVNSEAALTFGASVSLEDVKSGCEKSFPALYNMLAVFGSVQIRNIATLGGNLGTASPIGDTPPVLMAYDASVTVQSLRGKRTLKIRDFITGYRETLLEPDEIIVSVSLPKLQNGTLVKSYKISKRKDLDISTVSAGFSVDLYENNMVKNVFLAYGGMAAMTKRAKKAEQHLSQKAWTREVVEQAMPLIDEEFTPISDARAGAEGRRLMARNLLLKFWTETAV
jgi:xanthine dehydrogenase small subunit